jgi:hypothetical protein
VLVPAEKNGHTGPMAAMAKLIGNPGVPITAIAPSKW